MIGEELEACRYQNHVLIFRLERAEAEKEEMLQEVARIKGLNNSKNRTTSDKLIDILDERYHVEAMSNEALQKLLETYHQEHIASNQ